MSAIPQTPVLYASPSIDITKEIIELYDKSTAQMSAPKPAAPAASTPKPAAPAAAPSTPAAKPPTQPGTPANPTKKQ